MTITESGDRVGEGIFGDKELRVLQKKAGMFDIDLADRKKARQQLAEVNRTLAIEIYRTFQDAYTQEAPDAGEHLLTWCRLPSGETIGDHISGPLHTLYSGDSSQMRPYLAAPIAMAILERLMNNPDKPRIVGMGTDTADLLVPVLDAFLFDTNLPPVIVTGANHPHSAPDSDAAENFISTARVASLSLPPGGYYVFGRGKNLFQGIDLIKVDPTEARAGGLEGQSTFYAPHGTNANVRTVLQYAPRRSPRREEDEILPEDHVLRNMTVEDLYDALTGVLVVDLGDQNAGEVVMDQIFDPSVKTIVVAGHSLGNADNEIRHYLIKAAQAGKTVIVVSRSLIGKTDSKYDAALLRENAPGGALHGSDTPFVDGSGLNVGAARAIAARAIVEELTPLETQELLTRWRRARNLRRSSENSYFLAPLN